MAQKGQVIILNGAPRSGKSSIVKVIQDTFDGVWMNLGVDVFARGVTPRRYQPGIGLRPGPGPAQWQLHTAPIAGGLSTSCGTTEASTGTPDPGVAQTPSAKP